MRYDVIVIGAGISGLTAASLLAKKGLRVAVFDKSYNPGGSCGTFKRKGMTFDQGSSMLYGFGEKGFNPHRFVFNCLEEPISVVQHDALYCVNYDGKRIIFWSDVDLFAEELGKVFPGEKSNIIRFYRDMLKMYQHIMVENPVFSTPDQTDPQKALQQLIKHPLSYAKFLSYLNKSTKDLLKGYFHGAEILKFFDKLTSTYCYTTVEETPAVLSAVMFVDNHVGGSYYPAGSSAFLPGKLEKVIEAYDGEMFMESEVVKILFEGGRPSGIELKGGEQYFADNIIYSGTIWNLYGKLIDDIHLAKGRAEWAKSFIPTYPSVVLYAYVDRGVIPLGTLPVEMLVGNPDMIDESEVTVYVPSLDDNTLCGDDGHVIMAIGPSWTNWEIEDPIKYLEEKENEKVRLNKILEKRFPGFTKAVRFSEVATPKTIERYTNKNKGAVAGPKQMIGQHMFRRLHTKSEWNTLFCCGESTVMGTGTPAVTVSGLSAANAVLAKRGLPAYAYRKGMKNYVNIVENPFSFERLYQDYNAEEQQLMRKASVCQFCEHPACMNSIDLDVRGIMRRISVGNFAGAGKLAWKYALTVKNIVQEMKDSEKRCVMNEQAGKPVEIAMTVYDLCRYVDNPRSV
jgi:prolycopene isomerase